MPLRDGQFRPFCLQAYAPYPGETDRDAAGVGPGPAARRRRETWNFSGADAISPCVVIDVRSRSSLVRTRSLPATLGCPHGLETRKGISMTNYIRSSALIALVVTFSAPVSHAQEKPFDLHGTYVEGCSCSMVCTCSLNGSMVPGCQVMGAMIISSGTYGDDSLSGDKVAFAVGHGWVRIFVESNDSAQAKTAGALAKALLSPYGTIESVRDAEIELSGSDGNYTLSVGEGKVILLKTQPVLGADGKTAVTYTNYPDPLLRTIMQGKVVSGSYDDGEHHFALKGSNSFFNQNWSASGNE